MGFAAIPTKNRMHADPEVLVFQIQLEQATLQKMAVELNLSFDGRVIGRQAPTSTAGKGRSSNSGTRLASVQHLIQRHTSVDAYDVSVSAADAIRGSWHGSSSRLQQADWNLLSVSPCHLT